MGKMSIRVEEHDVIEFLFISKRRNLKLRLKLREGIPELIERISSKEGLSSASAYVEKAELKELFEETVC